MGAGGGAGGGGGVRVAAVRVEAARTGRINAFRDAAGCAAEIAAKLGVELSEAHDGHQAESFSSVVFTSLPFSATNVIVTGLALPASRVITCPFTRCRALHARSRDIGREGVRGIAAAAVVGRFCKGNIASTGAAHPMWSEW